MPIGGKAMPRLRRKIDTIKVKDGNIADIIINALAERGFDIDVTNDDSNFRNNITIDIYRTEEREQSDIERPKYY